MDRAGAALVARLLLPGFVRAALFLWLAESRGTSAAAWRRAATRFGGLRQLLPWDKPYAWLPLRVIR